MKLYEAAKKLDNVKNKMFDKLAKKGLSTKFSHPVCSTIDPLIFYSYFDTEFFIDSRDIMKMDDEQLFELVRSKMILGLSKTIKILKEIK